MMIRTQIQLTEEQLRRVKRLSRQRNVSIAEVIRSFVDQGVSAESPRRDEAYQRARALVGRFPDKNGARDLSRDHDRYLGEVFE